MENNVSIIGIGNFGIGVAMLIKKKFFINADLIFGHSEENEFRQLTANQPYASYPIYRYQYLKPFRGSVKSDKICYTNFQYDQRISTAIICVSLDEEIGCKYAPLIALDAKLKHKHVITILLSRNPQTNTKNPIDLQAQFQLEWSSNITIEQNMDAFSEINVPDFCNSNVNSIEEFYLGIIYSNNKNKLTLDINDKKPLIELKIKSGVTNEERIKYFDMLGIYSIE